ncbi:MAG TPA: phosphatase PAP2 family protein [Acidimicrobiia bacterium]|nr:phosphatase PAP2 family protein [Acidimicrobiia bacterium]
MRALSARATQEESARTDRVPSADEPLPGPLTKRMRGGWVLEVLGLLIAGVLHDYLRNAEMGPANVALRNARTLNRIEQWLGIYHELDVQRFFLHWPATIVFWNLYYDTAHFIVPIVVAVFLYVKFPVRYVRMRNTFLIMLFFTGPICWALFPVSPPKYMGAQYGFVDTQVEYYNGPGRQVALHYGPDGEPRQDLVDAVGNLYGGMPSHHVSWALFCVLALWPVVRRWWVKAIILLHPILTLGAITVTGQHHFLDFFGSCVEVTVAYLLAIALERALARRRARRRAFAHGGEAAIELRANSARAASPR